MSDSPPEDEEATTPEPSEDEVAEIEAEREQRLDPANRPDNAEVDNTGDRMPEVAKEENQPE